MASRRSQPLPAIHQDAELLNSQSLEKTKAVNTASVLHLNDFSSICVPEAEQSNGDGGGPLNSIAESPPKVSFLTKASSHNSCQGALLLGTMIDLRFKLPATKPVLEKSCLTSLLLWYIKQAFAVMSDL